MSITRLIKSVLAFTFFVVAIPLFAADSPPATSVVITNGRAQLRWSPYAGADRYEIYSTDDLNSQFTLDTAGSVTGLTFTASSGASGARFYLLSTTPMSSNNLLAGIAMNRIAYGPTPDDLEKLLDYNYRDNSDNSTNMLVWTNLSSQVFTGAAAYIAMQMEPWRIVEDVTNTHTNISIIANKFLQPTQNVNLVTTNVNGDTHYVLSTNARYADLQSWFILHAIGAKRQLLETMLQFLDNHFTTQWSKESDYLQAYFGGGSSDGTLRDAGAAGWEFWEIDKWRNVLLNPNGNFLDLLRVHIESPAEIVYLDTVGSRGDSTNVPNENYARELMELFTMGVDNGYEQTDITEMSKLWTGWKTRQVDFSNAFNPLATTSTTNRIPGALNGSSTNLMGTIAFNYQSSVHRFGTKLIWTNSADTSTGPAGSHKVVPARFGTNWASASFKAGYDYSFSVPNLSGTNSIREGYMLITNLNNLPFTAEYMSVKLCRLFCGENFPNPTTRTNTADYITAYNFYNYTDTNRSAEAELVRQCMVAWESTTPMGQIWKVVGVILNSDYFRSQSSASQKVKTPFEYMVSAIRAMASSTNGTRLQGSFTAYSDGSSVPAPMLRMGNMALFNRDAPDGWPEYGAYWINAAALAERVRWAQALAINTGQNGKSDAGNSIANPAALIAAKFNGTSKSKSTPSDVAEYLVNIIYPTEGRANMDSYKKLIVSYLNDGSADPNSLDRAKTFNQLTDFSANSTYDLRMRGAAALLLSMPRFNEQ